MSSNPREAFGKALQSLDGALKSAVEASASVVFAWELLQVHEAKTTEAPREWRDTVYLNALAVINTGREAMGLPELADLPQGEKTTRGCPTTRALGADVMGIKVAQFADELQARRLAACWGRSVRRTVVGTWEVVDIPNAITRFINAFDAGRYPELERKR